MSVYCKWPHSSEPYLFKDKKIWESFGKGHRRNNFMKSFQNLTGCFREEEFSRISSWLYGESSPHLPEPCLLTDQNFANNFEKRSPKNFSLKLFQNLNSNLRQEDLLRMSLCPFSASSTHLPGPRLFTDQNFANSF